MIATLIVHWPGKDVPMCAIHAEKAMGIAHALGFKLSVDLCMEEMFCTNCENEQGKRSNPKTEEE